MMGVLAWRCWRAAVLASALMSSATGSAASEENVMRFGEMDAQENFSNAQIVELLRAACQGDASTVKALVEAGADVTDPGRYGVPPLFWMVTNQCVAGVGVLVAAGAPVNATLDRGETPLWVAAGYGFEEMITALISHGADLDAVGKEQTPLVVTARRSQWAAMRLLVEAGADVNWVSRSRRTAAKALVAVGKFSELIYFLEHGYIQDLETVLGMSRSRVLPPDSEQLVPQQRAIEMMEKILQSKSQ